MATYPPLATGQRLTGALLQSMLPITARKSALTARTSTTAKTADPDLVVPVEANATYELQFCFITDGALSTAAAAGFAWAFTVPAGTTGTYSMNGLSTTVANSKDDVTFGYAIASSGATGTVGAGVIADVIGTGTFITAGTAGNLTLTWAQNTSNATATNLQANSYIKITRIG